VNPKSGVTKKGRPPGASALTRARAEKVHVARSAGIDEEPILGFVAPELMPRSGTSRERRRAIRRTLDRIERAAGIEPAPRDGAKRQAYAYAERRLGAESFDIPREPGWPTDRKETPDQMRRKARQLEASAAWWRARADAGLVTPDLEEYEGLVEGHVAALRERAQESKSPPELRTFNASSLSAAERAKYAL